MITQQFVRSNNSYNKTPKIEGKNASLGTPLDIRPTTEFQERETNYQERYTLLKSAQSIIHHMGKDRDEQERIVKCCTQAAPFQTPTVMYDQSANKAYISGLEHCNSDSCPVCAQKRANDHRERLTVFLAEAKKQGYFPLMVTLTTSHHKREKLAKVADGFARAYDRLFSGRWWQDTKSAYDIADKVKFIESPIGENGWHVHAHIIVLTEMEFVNNSKPMRELTDHFSKRWQNVLRRGGRYASWERGVDIKAGWSEVVNYVAKYGKPPKNELDKGIESEASQGHLKRGRSGGLAPFELLAVAAGVHGGSWSRFCEMFGYTPEFSRENPTAIEAHAGLLYQEYYWYWKGKSRVHWGYVGKKWDIDAKLEEYKKERDLESELYELCSITSYPSLWRNNQVATLRAIVEEKRGDLEAIADECSKQKIDVHIFNNAYERFYHIRLD